MGTKEKQPVKKDVADKRPEVQNGENAEKRAPISRYQDKAHEYASRNNVIERQDVIVSPITNVDRAQLKPVLLDIFKLKSLADDAYSEIDMWLTQKTLAQEGKIDEKKLLCDMEYFSMKDQKGNILGVGGIYTVKTSAPGFDAKNGSWIVARSGWTGVTVEARGKGYGKLIVQIEMQRARDKGASIFCWETSLLWNSIPTLLGSLGFTNDSNVKDYYGKGIDLRSFYASLDSVDVSTSAKLAETYEISKLKWLKPAFGDDRFARLSDVVEKAAYTKSIAETFPGMISATPYIVMENAKPIGFFLFSIYHWEGEPAKTPKVTFVAAEHGKEDIVVKTIVQKAKELGMRMVVVEVPKGKNMELESALKEVGLTTSKSIKGMYGAYELEGKSQDLDLFLFAREITDI